MKDIFKLAYYFKNYSQSLQKVTYNRTGKYFHDGQHNPVELVYLCPLCLKKKIAVIGDYQYLDGEFSLDHFPPACVGGKETILVCEGCNSTSGAAFEHALKDFVHEVSATTWVPGTKVPVTLNVEDVVGNYKAHLIVKGPYDFEWSLPNYPLLKKRFEEMFREGKPMVQNITFKKRELDLVYKALLKAAYLFCFSRWKYDFAYTNTAAKIRGILHHDEKHPLSNCGVFFHTKKPFPPEGLCYVFKPKELQTFMVTFSLTNTEAGHTFMASVLIPGSDDSCWREIVKYLPIIDKQERFTSSFIALPPDLVPSDNHFPYTATWNSRSTFKIEGETN